MDNTLPGNPSNPNNDNPNQPPPPFGSGFNPHTNPIDPNNPYQSQSSSRDKDDPVDPVQSWVAQHQQRDENGRFVSSEHMKTDSQTTPTSHISPNHSNSYPSPISFTQNTQYSERNDPPLVAVSVTNPVTYLKLFLKRLLKNEGIDFRLKIKPLTVIAMATALSVSFGAGFNVAQIFFPNSSPILHRSITLQGNIQKSETGQYYLSLPDGSFWTLRPTNQALPNSLTNSLSKQALVKGNLNAEPNVIEVKEVIPFEKPVQSTPVYNPVATNSAQFNP